MNRFRPSAPPAPSSRAVAVAVAVLLGAAFGPSPAARAAASPAAVRPLPIDSLVHEELKRVRIIAPDLGALAALRRESEYATNQFRRYLGTYPPVLGIAALGTLPDPDRVSDAVLNLADYKCVLRDWPPRPGAPRPALDSTATEWQEQASERIMRWYLPIVERDLGKGTPPEGRTRFAPDWFESALAGFATQPTEQNARVSWMDAHMGEHVPIEKFLSMPRPAARPAGAKRRAAKSAEPTQRLFDAEAVSFARFLTHREGERFIGHFYERLLAGEPQTSAFGLARTLLPAPDVLEKEWIAWVNEGPNKKIATPGARGDEQE